MALLGDRGLAQDACISVLDWIAALPALSQSCVVPVLRCPGTEVVLDGEVSFLFHRSVFLDLFPGLRATGFTAPA